MPTVGIAPMTACDPNAAIPGVTMPTKRAFSHRGGSRHLRKDPLKTLTKCVEAFSSSGGRVIDRTKIYDFHPYWGFRQPKIG